MAIQNRRGAYADFDPQKLVPGEWAVVQSGDPNSTRGKSVYMAFDVGDVERMATYEDMQENIVSATTDVQEQFADELTQTIADANSTIADIQDDADTLITNTSTTVSQLTGQVTTAVSAANTATSNANAATNRANDAIEAIQHIIDEGNTVLSWNGRTGEVQPTTGDYTSAQITHGTSTVANALTFDSSPTAGSERAVQSGGVYSYISSLLNGFTVVDYTSGSMQDISKSGIYYVYNAVTDKPEPTGGILILNRAVATNATGTGLYVPNTASPNIYKITITNNTWAYRALVPFKWKAASYTASDLPSGYTDITTNITFPNLTGYTRTITSVYTNSAYTGATGAYIDNNDIVHIRCRNFYTAASSPTITFIMEYINDDYMWT